MVIRRKSELAPPPPPAAPTLSFFDYLRDLGVDPNPTTRDDRDVVDDLRADYYIEVAEGRIIEPDAIEDPDEIRARVMDELPTTWTRNVGATARDLIAGMEVRFTTGNAIWTVNYVTPTGASIKRIDGESNLPDLIVISTRSELWYRRATTTTGSGVEKKHRKRRGIDASQSRDIKSNPRKTQARKQRRQR